MKDYIGKIIQKSINQTTINGERSVEKDYAVERSDVVLSEQTEDGVIELYTKLVPDTFFAALEHVYTIQKVTIPNVIQ